MEPRRVLGSERSVKPAAESADAPPVQHRGRERFADFYRREYERSLRLAWLLTGSRAEAEDVVQDAMTGVYREFDRLRVPEAYLKRAVVNRARTRRRDERRQRERLRSSEPADAAPDASDGELLRLVAQLPYRQRVVIVARYWGDWSEREISDALGCRPGTVKSLASRALTRLRAEVTP
jgi:RNA polymerase sigma factor (sigma-70 family)